MKDLNIEQIKSLIPHRYPFLLIDKLVDIIPNESATGIKNVTFNENYFQGHFDSRSVMPGALIIESMAQSAGTLVMHSLKKTQKNMSVYLLTVDKAKFRKIVLLLRIRARLITQRSSRNPLTHRLVQAWAKVKPVVVVPRCAERSSQEFINNGL